MRFETDPEIAEKESSETNTFRKYSKMKKYKNYFKVVNDSITLYQPVSLETKENPEKVNKDYVNDPVITLKLQKLIDTGLISFDSR